MPQHSHAHTTTCTDCAGFASATITTGTRNTDGTRTVLAVDCPACSGSGVTTAPANSRSLVTR